MRFYEFKQFSFSEATQELTSIEVPTGRSGIEVADIQKLLVALGYDLPRHGVDGIRGPETSSAVKAFQADNGLTVDGDPGSQTVSKMNSILKAKPELSKKLTKSSTSDVKRSQRSASNIDVSVIQDPDFDAKLQKIAGQLGVEKRNLIAIMKQESGVNPKAVNRMSGATGLIQFMPNTARQLGTTVEELRTMSAVEQLDYVYKYFKMVGVGDGSLGDLYMAVFMPAHVGKPDSHVLGASGAPGFSGKVYAQNKGLDRNRDGTITISDVKQSVQRFA